MCAFEFIRLCVCVFCVAFMLTFLRFSCIDRIRTACPRPRQRTHTHTLTLCFTHTHTMHIPQPHIHMCEWIESEQPAAAHGFAKDFGDSHHHYSSAGSTASAGQQVIHTWQDDVFLCGRDGWNMCVYVTHSR